MGGPIDGLIQPLALVSGAGPVPTLEIPVWSDRIRVPADPRQPMIPQMDMAVYERAAWAGPGVPAVIRYVFQGIRVPGVSRETSEEG